MSKLLIVAPTCDVEDVGEAWVAYQWVQHLARRHDATLLTYNKRGRIPASQQLSGLRVVEWTEPRWLGQAERFNSMMKPGYLPFYVKAQQWIKRALSRGERFDIAHQPVPVAMRYPCPIAGMRIPYVIGPVGGSLNSPPGFADEDSGPFYQRMRRLDTFRIHHDPWLNRSYRQASCVLGIAEYVKEFLAGIGLKRFEVLSETGIESLPTPTDRSGRNGVVKLLYVGRLVRTKGARDAVSAMTQLSDLPVTLDIIGDGYDRAACEAVARQVPGDRVRFYGRLPRAALDEFYRSADIFVFPSYREPGGNVTLEAMSHGLPSIVTDLGGPGNAVDDNSGIRISPLTPQQLSTDIARSVRRLVENASLRLSLGAAARQRVANTALWDRKIDRVDALYSEILDLSS